MNWWNPSTPENIRPVPWMHPAAVAYLDTLLTPDMHVIEHGCGGSTLWFAERVKSVDTYDINGEWIAAVRHDRVNRHLYTAGKAKIRYYNYLYDLFFVDGAGIERPEWIRSAPSIVKPGGVVVVDNSEREHYQAALRELAIICTSPTQITAWTDYGKLVQTSFYRLKGGTSWI